MRIKINKYLRNIGINENTYWVIKDKVEGDFRYEEDEDGFVEAETWNLNITLAMMNYSYLCYFREHCLKGCPCTLTFEKWKEYIDKMIDAFELIITDKDEPDICKVGNEEFKRLSKRRNKRINFGLRLYVKYFNDLWW